MGTQFRRGRKLTIPRQKLIHRHIHSSTFICIQLSRQFNPFFSELHTSLKQVILDLYQSGLTKPKAMDAEHNVCKAKTGVSEVFASLNRLANQGTKG